MKFISVDRQKLDLSKYIYLWYHEFYICRDTAGFYEHKKMTLVAHENRLPKANSHKISYFIFFGKLGKMLQNLLFAAVLIDAMRVKEIKYLS